LQQARTVRLAAEAACCDIEDMLWDIERSRCLWQRLAQSIAMEEEQTLLPLAA
jgi:hypothetical protein